MDPITPTWFTAIGTPVGVTLFAFMVWWTVQDFLKQQAKRDEKRDEDRDAREAKILEAAILREDRLINTLLEGSRTEAELVIQVRELKHSVSNFAQVLMTSTEVLKQSTLRDRSGGQ